MATMNLTSKQGFQTQQPAPYQTIYNDDPTLKPLLQGMESNYNGQVTPNFGANGQINGFNTNGNFIDPSFGNANQFMNEYNTDLAATNKYQGDVADFTNQLPLYRSQALGNIVGRGLSASFDPNSKSLNSGALGSQVMNQFDNNVGKTLGSMAGSYSDFMGNASLQQQARANALQNFMQNQNYLNQYQQQQQPGFSDIASIGLGLAGLVI